MSVRLRKGGALTLPFLIGALALRLAIAPIGDAIAGSVARATRSPAPRTLAPGLASADIHRERDDRGKREAEPGTAEQSRSSCLRASGAPCEKIASPSTDPKTSGEPKGTIVVPASAVTRAMQRRDVGATNATAADGSALGARLAGVSRYRTGLRDGDVVVSVAGTRTSTVQAMVAAAMQAASLHDGGGRRLSGRIVRGADTFAVVIELPQ